MDPVSSNAEQFSVHYSVFYYALYYSPLFTCMKCIQKITSAHNLAYTFGIH
jgi:hypothetical protein